MRLELKQAVGLGAKGANIELVEVNAGWIPEMLSCHSSVRSTISTATSQSDSQGRNRSAARQVTEGAQANHENTDGFANKPHERKCSSQDCVPSGK